MSRDRHLQPQSLKGARVPKDIDLQRGNRAYSYSVVFAHKDMAASDCANFRPNLWRPSTCANCYRPKVKHALGIDGTVTQSTEPTTVSVAIGKDSPSRARSRSYRELEAKSPIERIAEAEGKQVREDYSA